MGMGISQKLGNEGGGNWNWIDGNGREWECWKPFPHISNTEQLDGVAKRDHRPCDVNAARGRYLISLGLSPEQNCLRLGWVEKQPVLKEPASDVTTLLVGEMYMANNSGPSTLPCMDGRDFWAPTATYWYRPVTNDSIQPRALPQMPKSEEMRSRRMLWSKVSNAAVWMWIVSGSAYDKISVYSFASSFSSKHQ